MNIIKNANDKTEEILQSATAEFLGNGFEKASMRVIAKNAGVTTGSLYARFPNKDAIFGALVSQVAEEFIKINQVGNKTSVFKLESGEEKDILSSSGSTVFEMVDLIYQNKDCFSLLINCSQGSSYHNFIDKIVENEERETIEFLNIAKEKGLSTMDVSNQVIHMLVSAHVHALFEIVRHDISKEDALLQLNQTNEFFACGWNKMFGLNQ